MNMHSQKPEYNYVFPLDLEDFKVIREKNAGPWIRLRATNGE